MAAPYLVPALQAGATVLDLKGISEYNKNLSEDAKAEAADAMFTAKQLEANAKAVKAQGTRSAYFQRKQGETAESDARARMAAGGGGVDTEKLAEFKSVTDYNVMAQLYDSERRAKGLSEQAGAKRREAALAMKRAKRKKKSYIGTILSGSASIYNSMPGD